MLNRTEVAQAAAYPWSGASFSERIWNNADSLARALRQAVTQGLIQGQDVRQMSAAIAKATGSSAADAERLRRVREEIAARGQHLLCLSGASARDTVARFVESPQGLAGTVTAIKNRYFGGNVDVTGLIVACDILEQLPQDLSGVMLFVPKLMFNADGMTLDEYHRDELLASLTGRDAEVHVVSTMPHELLDTLEHILGITPANSTIPTDPTH